MHEESLEITLTVPLIVNKKLTSNTQIKPSILDLPSGNSCKLNSCSNPESNKKGENLFTKSSGTRYC